MHLFKTLTLLLSLGVIVSCKQTSVDKSDAKADADWKQYFNKQLPLLGHRNWVMVVDKAFPLQTAPGMEYIDTHEKFLPALQYVLQQIDSATHVSPIIYKDTELSFITENQVPGITDFKKSAEKLLMGHKVQTMLHDSVFTQMDHASKLFKILVIKTNETIPYSSVFLQLECKYWNSEKEHALRQSMR